MQKKLLSSLFFVLSACGKPIPNCYESKAINTDFSDSFSLADVSFDQVSTVIDAKCASCHSTGSSNGDLTDKTVFDSKSQKVLENSKNKHQNTNLDSNEQKIIADYVASLTAPPVTETPTTPPAPQTPSAEEITTQFTAVSEVMKKHCTVCHSTQTPTAGVILDTEADFKKSSKLVKTYISNGHKGTSVAESDQKIVSDYIVLIQEPAKPAPSKPSGTKPTTNSPQSSDANVQFSDPCTVNKIEKNDNANSQDADALGDIPILKVNEVKACHAKNLVFDRKNNKCHETQLSFAYKCNWAGVQEKFQGVAGASEQIKELIADKWLVDQCGAQNGIPHVFLLKYIDINGALGIETKILSAE